MQRKTSLMCVLFACTLLWVASARAQDESGEGSAEMELDVELDYSGSENMIFDEEAYHAAEAELHVGQGVKSSTYTSYLHMGTVQLGGPSGQPYPTMAIPKYYVVEPGDTLLDISARFFGNPDLWPEIWALNQDITNPNWIYPGQVLQLLPESQKPQTTKPDQPKIVFAAKWKPGTVIYRNPGFVDKEIEKASGEIVGSFHETQYLAHLNSVYIKYEEGKAPGIGSTATVYRIDEEVKDPKKKKKTHGKLVDILGTVKVTEVDEEHRIATAIITESLDVIERGDLVGPMKWKLAVVAPVDASLDLEGQIISTHEPITTLGEGHVVYVDLGYEDGVVEGNTFYVVRKRDHYMETLDEDDADPDFPWETIGRALVLESLKQTSTCLLVESSWDVKVGDKVELRRGQ